MELSILGEALSQTLFLKGAQGAIFLSMKRPPKDRSPNSAPFLGPPKFYTASLLKRNLTGNLNLENCPYSALMKNLTESLQKSL